MSPAALLVKKRDGHELSDDEIRFLVNGFTCGEIADYQMSAFAMAVCIQGMTPRETATLTKAMQESGESLPRDVSDQSECPRLDKHSTGGLGDKVSLILAPMLSVFGIHVPMISGRGLGLTGGTLDKLESIPGFRCNLSIEESNRVLNDVGTFIVSATEQIAPADRKLYSLRDVTGTVESIPLITASILSKKLSAGLDALVMDVKVGQAAGMKTNEEAFELAASLQRVGAQAGLPTSVIVSDMDQPLGQAVGNAIEVNESMDVLKGNGPDSVRELSIQLAANLLQTVETSEDRSVLEKKLAKTLDDGTAYEKFSAMVSAQGGSLSKSLLVANSHDIVSTENGYLKRLDCGVIGASIVSMGGGRRRVSDQIDHSVGVSVKARIGDKIEKGQTIMRLHCHSSEAAKYVSVLGKSFILSDSAVAPHDLIVKRFD